MNAQLCKIAYLQSNKDDYIVLRYISPTSGTHLTEMCTAELYTGKVITDSVNHYTTQPIDQKGLIKMEP